MAIKLRDVLLLMTTSGFVMEFVASAAVNNSGFCKNATFDFDCGAQEHPSRRCISSLWNCDHIFDCKTGADEFGCKYLHECRPGEFSCRDGDCYPASKRCDGTKDCLDGSDERACAVPPAYYGQQDEADRSPHISIAVVKTPPKPQRDHHHQQSFHHNDVVGHAEPEALESSDSETGKGSSGGGFLLFSCLLVAVAVALVALYITRRHPHTTSQIEHQMRELGHGLSTAGGSVWSMVSEHFSPQQQRTQSRVEVINGASIVPPQHQQTNNGADNQLCFDNPLNTFQQPQPFVLSVPSQQQGSPYQQHLVV